MTHICQLTDHHWFRWWLVAWLAPSHYLNQCWNIVNWTFRNKLQWNLNWNLCIFIQENPFENVVWKMAAILSWPQCVNEVVCILGLKTSPWLSMSGLVLDVAHQQPIDWASNLSPPLLEATLQHYVNLIVDSLWPCGLVTPNWGFLTGLDIKGHLLVLGLDIKGNFLIA